MPPPPPPPSPPPPPPGAARVQVWLPSLGVWAGVPDDHEGGGSGGSGGSSGGSRCSGKARAASVAHCSGIEARRPTPTSADADGKFGTATVVATATSTAATIAAGTDHPACPICLADLEDANKAVLCWCMHSYCVSCIDKWSKVRRLCPLCKAEYVGWYYNIHGDGSYKEKVLPLLPIESKEKETASHWLDLVVDGGAREPGWLQHSRDQLDRQRQERRRRAGPARRGIYRLGLHAIKLGGNQEANWQRLACDEARRRRMMRRLEPWVARELKVLRIALVSSFVSKALLRDSDVSLLVHFVLGIWTSHLEKRLGSRSFISQAHQDGQLDKDVAAAHEAARQLTPFLGSGALHFWHELRCFALSPYAMEAYDMLVQYQDHNDTPLQTGAQQCLLDGGQGPDRARKQAAGCCSSQNHAEVASRYNIDSAVGGQESDRAREQAAGCCSSHNHADFASRNGTHSAVPQQTASRETGVRRQSKGLCSLGQAGNRSEADGTVIDDRRECEPVDQMSASLRCTDNVCEVAMSCNDFRQGQSSLGGMHSNLRATNEEKKRALEQSLRERLLRALEHKSAAVDSRFSINEVL
eukprot:SM000039S14556  [mRNA]  locus=s39:770209:773368:- [translate_table: standard]